ncbi:MAG: dephospho-CoA kinase [Beijerinckiaceae bacterium]
MILIGLTGSIGMGKSTASAMFRACGVPVYDADAAVHRLYAGPAVEPMSHSFPEAIVNGCVDRTILSRLVMSDPAALRRIEAIVHPLVARDRADFLQNVAAQSLSACVLDVPLLFETGGDRAVDVIVVVSASPEVQQARVLARPGMSAEKYATILTKQTPDREKRRRAHFVVDTGRGLEAARRQVQAFLVSLGN